MKLYDSFGMNPRTVRMFCIEKGLTVDTVQVDLLGGENRRAPYTDKNPAGQTPMLELDDGTCVSETYAICEYLEETRPDTPSLIGKTSRDRAETRMWWRRVELNVCVPAVHGFYYAEGHDLFKDRVACDPSSAAFQKERAQRGLAWLETLLGNGQFVAGDRFTVADICLFCYVDLLRNAGQGIDPMHGKLTAWFDRVSKRPSAEGSLFPVQPMGLRG